jgi:hypothetical protein
LVDFVVFLFVTVELGSCDKCSVVLVVGLGFLGVTGLFLGVVFGLGWYFAVFLG